TTHLHVPPGKREARRALGDADSNNRKPARDLADFLRGKLDCPPRGDYKPRRPVYWPLVFCPMPLFVPLVGAVLWLGGVCGVVTWVVLGLVLSLLALILMWADRWGVIRKLALPPALTVVGLLVMVALYFGGKAIGGAFSSAPNWTKYTAPDGRWAILMPRNPEVGTAPAPGMPQLVFERYEARLPWRGGEVMGLGGSLGGAPGLPLAQRVAGAKQGVLNSDRDIRFIKEKNLLLHGRHPGREYWFEHPRNGKACFRLYIVGNTLYALCVGSSKLDESDFYKFLDSFEVLGNPPAVANAPINNLPPPNWGGDMVKPLLPHLEKPIEWPQLPEVPVPKPPDDRGAPPWTPQPPRV